MTWHSSHWCVFVLCLQRPGPRGQGGPPGPPGPAGKDGIDVSGRTLHCTALPYGAAHTVEQSTAVPRLMLQVAHVF